MRELLEDQEKRYYPIVSLPTSITQQLLYARKYIFSFFSDCVVLCNMGLLSIGPQILKEKDKVRADQGRVRGRKHPEAGSAAGMP